MAILGHEISGVVAEVGPAVTGLTVRVTAALDPGRPCLTCAYCRAGRNNLCVNMFILGSAGRFPHVQGGFAQHLILRPDQIVPVVAREHMGATLAVNVAAHPDVLAPFEGDGGYFDVAFEASGSQQALASLFKVIRRGGRIVQAGMLPPGSAPVPVNVLQSREIDLVGAFQARNEFRLAVHLIVSATIDVSSILSGTYPLAEAATVLEIAGNRAKVVKLHLALQENGR